MTHCKSLALTGPSDLVCLNIFKHCSITIAARLLISLTFFFFYSIITQAHIALLYTRKQFSLYLQGRRCILGANWHDWYGLRGRLLATCVCVPAHVPCALDGVCGFLVFFFPVNVTAENTSV